MQIKRKRIRRSGASNDGPGMGACATSNANNTLTAITREEERALKKDGVRQWK